MKNYIYMFLITASILLVGCGGGGGGGSSDDVPKEEVSVNLLGSWNYTQRTENSICDGLDAKAIVTVQSLNGDVSVMGDVLLQGENFEIDRFQNCIFVTLDEINSDWVNRPAVQTAAEYLSFTNLDNAGDDTIKSVKITSFNNSVIIEVTEYTNGVIITEYFER